jgi:hypothetical protein
LVAGLARARGMRLDFLESEPENRDMLLF